MKLNEEAVPRDGEVEYLLETENGQLVRSSMRAEVADEIVRRAESLATTSEGDFALVVNDRMRFPMDAFSLEEGEEKPKRRRTKRARKAAEE